MKFTTRETLNVRHQGMVLSLFVALVLVPVMTACAGGPMLSDPRTMTFKPVEFTPPEPNRVVLDNGMVVYLLEDHELPLSLIHI